MAGTHAAWHSEFACDFNLQGNATLPGILALQEPAAYDRLQLPMHSLRFIVL
jgi:hypothetical protein